MSEQELLDKCRAMVQTVDEVSGHLSVELSCDGKPVLAKDFAFLVNQTVKCLEAIDESKSVKWGIIEANIIGDSMSFTLKGYGKELFKAHRMRDKDKS